MNRVGFGYDVHALVEGRPLWLGGVQIPHDKGLDGHSDADALIHAIADALLGAIGEGDIGVHFPNNDDRWKNIRSTVFLEQIALMFRKRKAVICNIDATLVSEAPKIMPHAGAMKKALAEALMITTDRINIKATTNETMGFIGRKEGIAAMAVAMVELP
jgi:2-C-methyl-D-erythritol 2,4-cyclodiphosphate synthase